MNYLEIVLQVYFNENSKEFLEKCFLREFKKAEKEQFFEADEFFNGCLKVIEVWEKHLQDKVFERKRELCSMLKEAKNGTLSYNDMEGKTIEQKRQETIEYCEQELKDVRPDGIGSLSFTVHLNSLTNGRINYNMAYREVLSIKKSIQKAFEKSTYKPVFKYETDENFEASNMAENAFYLLGEPNTNFPDEIKQLILHVFNRVKKENEGMEYYHFNVHDFLQFQQVTDEVKQAILDKFNIVLSWYPNDLLLKYKEEIKQLIIDYNPFSEQPQPINSETNTKKYTAKHYLLAYLFECNAKGESYPIGNKKELERIGNERMGAGKGNRFYKVFNEITDKDLNAENILFEIGGEYWRKAVVELSKNPELVEKYLQSKQL